MTEGPDGYALEAAHRVIIDHHDRGCPQCRGRRCWLLEWAVKVTVLSPVPDDLEWTVRLAARRVAEVHWPAEDGLCNPCLLTDCEPGVVALTYLNVLHDSWWPPQVTPPRVERALRGPVPSVETLQRITGLS